MPGHEKCLKVKKCLFCCFWAFFALGELFHPRELRFIAPDFFVQCVYSISFAWKKLVTRRWLVCEKYSVEWRKFGQNFQVSPLSAAFFNETSLLEVRWTPEQKGKMRRKHPQRDSIAHDIIRWRFVLPLGYNWCIPTGFPTHDTM